MKFLISICLLFVLISSCEDETTRLTEYPVQGIDLSRYQAKIDWQAMADQNISFAFIKASQGEMYNDPLFCENWEAAKMAGIKRGAYHYFAPSVPAEKQASNFINIVRIEYGDLPPVLDFEETNNLPKEVVIDRIKAWLYLVELEYSIRPIIYTHFKFYNKYIVGNFDQYPIWIAKYGKKAPPLGAGRPWHFWQYGNRGKLEGIEGYVDLNVFNGDHQQLEEFCLGPKALLSE